MPVRYRYYHSAWPTAAALSGLFFAAAAVTWRLCGGTNPPIIITMILGLVFGGAAAFFFFTHSAVECRIEGTTLWFRSLIADHPSSLQITDIVQITGVHDGESRWCEIAFRDGKVARINFGPLAELSQSTFGMKGTHRKFANAVLAVNPAIRFTSRDGRLCHACGKRMKPDHFPESRCSECGVPKPVALKQP
jgi:hypothetical protein